MTDRKAIGYFRMSTKAGALMRSDLESQRQTLREYAAAAGLRVVGECVDYENGKRAERTQLAKALAACAECGGLLVIPMLGPLARDPTFYIQLHVANVDFTILDMPGITRASLLSMGQAAQGPTPVGKPRRAEPFRPAARGRVQGSTFLCG
jgi:hypothetical protein